MRIQGGLALLACICVVAPAQATYFTGQNPDATAIFAQWVHASRVPTANVAITIVPEECSATVAYCYDPKQRKLYFPDTTYLWTNPAFASDDRDRNSDHAVFLHELGHVRDLTPRRATHRYRVRFLRMIGVRDYAKPNPWIAMISYHEFAVDPKELFAMAFEFCALDSSMPQTAEWAQGYGYTPTVAQHRHVCALLSRPLS